jgi:IstB-like ATP binding protein
VELKQHLVPKLKALRLSGILDTLEVRTQQAIAEHWSYGDFLERLLEDEVERRGQKQLALRVRRATLNTSKTLETFDFTFNPGINRQQMYDLAAGHYLHDKRNVLLCGPTGVGKSHLAQALAHEACRRGFDVVCTDAHQLLRHLHAGRLDNTYDKRLAVYTRADLLVIDDFGLKPMPNPADMYDVTPALARRCKCQRALRARLDPAHQQPGAGRMGQLVCRSAVGLGRSGSPVASGARAPDHRFQLPGQRPPAPGGERKPHRLTVFFCPAAESFSHPETQLLADQFAEFRSIS